MSLQRNDRPQILGGAQGLRGSRALRFSRLGVSVLLLSGCMTQPTLDVTKAPFRASTDLTEAPLRASSELTDGTSRAVSDLTEPTKEFLSSTTPGAWFTDDRTLKPEYKVLAFVVFNHRNLQEDLARGEGEYLRSLSVLLGVPAGHWHTFAHKAQSQYAAIYAREVTPIQSVHRLIHQLSPAARP